MKLNINHGLFQTLRNSPPEWWQNLVDDKELYIDARKGNYLNVYFNGGSLLKLKWNRKFLGEIHSKYIPLENEENYNKLEFSADKVKIGTIEPISLNNFEPAILAKIKSRIKQYSDSKSEKGIQGNYVVKNNIKNSSGFFIDTEFMYSGNRVDMVWVDILNKNIAFIELKTIGDNRLFTKANEKKSITSQLASYEEMIKKEKSNLLEFYRKVFQVKKDLRLLPPQIKIDSLSDFSILEKLILLIGDCTQNWINTNSKLINKKIIEVAFGSIYHGSKTFNFRIPFKNSHNLFRLSL